MPQIRPISYFETVAEISKACHAKREPLFITRNGRSGMVIMSMETYEELLDTAAVDRAIAQAEQEYKENGELYDAREVLSDLRGKYPG